MMTTMTRIPDNVHSNFSKSDCIFRKPRREDGKQIHDLIAQCPPLDENSSYCNFLQSTHFQNTCVLAEQHHDVIGFISAYRKPENERELFVWQVAVHPSVRGLGVAFGMLTRLLERTDLKDIDCIETTITHDNQGSWRLFKKLDRSYGHHGCVSTFLDEKRHFCGEHNTEYLFRIPLTH